MKHCQTCDNLGDFDLFNELFKSTKCDYSVMLDQFSFPQFSLRDFDKSPPESQLNKAIKDGCIIILL